MRARARRSTAGSTSGKAVRRVVACLCALGLTALLGAPVVTAAPGEIPGRGFLPDNRGWELVSPGDTLGLDARGLEGQDASSPDGNSVLFHTIGATAGSPAGGAESALYSQRDPQKGWSWHSIDAPLPICCLPHWRFFTDDFTMAAYTTAAKLTPDAEEKKTHLYLRNLRTGGAELLTPVGEPGSFFGGAANIQVGGISDGAKTVVYQSPSDQTGQSPPSTPNLYEWVSGQGVRLVSYDENENVLSYGSDLGSGQTWGTMENAVSSDGKRIIYHALEAEVSTAPAGQIYVRTDPDGSGPSAPSSVRATASQRTDCAGDPTCGGNSVPDPAPDPSGSLPGLYWNAEAEHADKLLFTSCEKLTDDSTAQAAFGQGDCADGNRVRIDGGIAGVEELYMYDVPSGKLTDLTTAEPNGGKVLGVVDVSDDLSRIYFVAGGILSSDTGANGTTATEDERNLYLWDEGTINFIATLTDTQGGRIFDGPFQSYAMGDNENYHLAPRFRKTYSRVTGDGQHLLFTSRARLSSYDNFNPAVDCDGPLEDADSCAEIYRFDADADELVCVSCNPSGEPPLLDSTLGDPEGPGIGLDPRFDPKLSHSMSEDGARIFFDTKESLLTRDSNGKRDVYQWTESGGLKLISTGRSGADSNFIDATPSGSDVFFATREPLMALDGDKQTDVYDARVGGGFPEPALPPPACEGDACQPAAAVPNDPTPGSSSFLGSTSPSLRSTVGKRCQKGERKVKRRGKTRCVEKPSRKNGKATRNQRQAGGIR